MTRCACETVTRRSYEPIWVIIETASSDSHILSPVSEAARKTGYAESEIPSDGFIVKLDEE